MRNDITDLKKLTLELMESGNGPQVKEDHQRLIQKIYGDASDNDENMVEIIPAQKTDAFQPEKDTYHEAETVEETLSLQEKEFEMIKRALERNKNKRKLAAKELGISERTLYRKIKQFDL
jgi:transcriptional regulator with PAS, ATPase and Fis domain